jgi:ADP-ribosyl-[dinitrogen reductase] hydrolase
VTEPRTRLEGGIWGALVGDALGVPFEFRSPDSIRAEDVRMVSGGVHGQPAGTWSDDGALTLALLDSLLSAGFDTADQARRYLAWADEGAYTPDGDGRFDIGGATATALGRIRAGIPAESAGGTDERSNGNGSLMRTLPIALVGRDLDDATLVEQAHRASAVTHAHPV